MFTHFTFRCSPSACLLAGVAAMLTLASCREYPAVHGREHNVLATYSGFTLTSDIPSPATVESVAAAGEEVFRGRGYAIKTKSLSTDYAEIVAIPPRTKDYPRATLKVASAGPNTRVVIAWQPLGDEEASRSILDGVLKRLGM